ncbi:MAG: hypothetical protein PWQ67_693, partial [Clostridia bacterium]|nr:hypothetical protein [Clostridia bacterium]MDN5322239.1 hypothetical protein [Clostridia bacterium]
ATGTLIAVMARGIISVTNSTAAMASIINVVTASCFFPASSIGTSAAQAIEAKFNNRTINRIKIHAFFKIISPFPFKLVIFYFLYSENCIAKNYS